MPLKIPTFDDRRRVAAENWAVLKAPDVALFDEPASRRSRYVPSEQWVAGIGGEGRRNKGT
jgi:hypothetical protein